MIMNKLLKNLLMLLDINCKISSITDFKSLLHEILLQAIIISKCNGGHIFVIDHEKPQLEISLNSPQNKDIDILPPSYSEVLKVIKAKMRSYIDDSICVDFDISKSIREAKLRAIITAPLIIDNRVAAVIQLLSYAPSYLTPAEFLFLDLLVSQGSIAIRNMIHAEEKQNIAALAAIGQISSHIAHDMRSPLAVLKGYVESDPSSSDQDALEYKRVANRSVVKLLRMADELVDYSKAAKVERSAIELGRFLNESIIIRQSDDVMACKPTIDCSTCANVYVSIDAYKMGRALMNLANNAIEATALNQGKIEITADVAQNRNLLITVSDNGKGIDAQHVPQIFDTFFTTGKIGGTGLGLSYCKQVIEAHGGTIDAQSEVGKGTTFTIHIPNCVVKKEMGVMIKGADLLKYAGKRFLLVDDDVDVRTIWRKKIEDNGGQVMWESDSAQKAITNEDNIDYESIDAAIVDFSFPGSSLSGIDVIEHFKSKGVKEIHLCTGYADDPDVIKMALAAGANSVIGKI